MSTNNDQSLGLVTSKIVQAKYQSDPLTLYTNLSANKTNTILLESAEISDKRALKSLMLLDAAVKIECHGFTVTINANLKRCSCY